MTPYQSKVASASEETLRSWASEHFDVCHGEGDPGYCLPEEASWTIECVDHATFAHLWANSEAANEWIQAEIKMDEDEGLNRGWAQLWNEPIEEEIVCLVRDGVAYIWDGHHRAAAAIATGRPVRAIVGHPRSVEDQSQSIRVGERG